MDKNSPENESLEACVHMPCMTKKRKNKSKAENIISASLVGSAPRCPSRRKCKCSQKVCALNPGLYIFPQIKYNRA